MEQLKKLGKFLWVEVRQGNLLVIAGLVLTYIFVVQPVYLKVIDLVEEHKLTRQVDREIGVNINELWERIDKLEKKTDKQFRERESGKLNVTRF